MHHKISKAHMKNQRKTQKKSMYLNINQGNTLIFCVCYLDFSFLLHWFVLNYLDLVHNTSIFVVLFYFVVRHRTNTLACIQKINVTYTKNQCVTLIYVEIHWFFLCVTLIFYMRSADFMIYCFILCVFYLDFLCTLPWFFTCIMWYKKSTSHI